MVTVLLIVLGAVLSIALRAAIRQLWMPKFCSWCTRASGHEVTGHTDDQCQGPRLAQSQRAEIEATHQRDLQRSEARLTEHTEKRKAERARTAARLRIEHIGNVTTRGREIHITGWRFSTHPFGTEVTGGQAYSYVGAPEQTSGWNVDELHAIAHGGACRCDVARLARIVR
ncbi:hypothetical protein ACFU7X_18230 [Streptomyces chartreusis]|uniref:hypothetical protein n=1 Tax=Streptomyces chartreusis TaxID=1969 RepID=UPI0036BB565B